MITAFDFSAYLFPSASSALGAQSKTQVDRLQISLDYSTWLAVGEGIANVQYALSPGSTPPLIISSSLVASNGNNVANSLLSFLASQGVPGVRYTISVTVQTLLGRTKTDQIFLAVTPSSTLVDGSSDPWGNSGPKGFPGGWPSGIAPPTTPVPPAQQQASLFNGQGTMFSSSYLQYTVSSLAPIGANIMDLWYNLVDGGIYQYLTDGNSAFWVSATAVPSRAPQCVVAIADPGPANYQIGDMWFNITTSKLNILANEGGANMWVIIN